MKKYFLLLLMPIITIAMEKAEPTFAIVGPIKTQLNHYHLYAKIDGKDVGEVSYKCRSRFEGIWELTHLEVKKPFRKQGAASRLFKQCIISIQKENGTKIIWGAVSYDANVHIEEIINFYKKEYKSSGFLINSKQKK